MKRNKPITITLADALVLSLLAEESMHGYQLDQELERREVRDWAELSRPQIYYSLKKLAALGLIASQEESGAAGGPERQTFATTPAGLAALQTKTEEAQWTQGRTFSRFNTWLALSHHAHPEAARRIVAQRRVFLETERQREQATRLALEAERSPMSHAAKLMVEFSIRHFTLELEWLDEVEALFAPSKPAAPLHEHSKK